MKIILNSSILKKELKEIKNFGQKSANEVVKKLQDRFDISLS